MFLKILIFFVLTFSSASGQSLVIGHITDTHYPRNRVTLVEFIENGLDEFVDTFIHTGDVTGRGTVELLNEYLDITGDSFLMVPGNHDQSKGKIDNWMAVIGDDQWFMDVNGYRLIGFNSQRVDWDFLARALSYENSILFAHFPLFPHRSETVNRRYRQEERDQLIKLIEEYRVIAYVYGHEHQDRIELWNGVYLICGKAFPSWRLIYFEDMIFRGAISGKMVKVKEIK